MSILSGVAKLRSNHNKYYFELPLDSGMSINWKDYWKQVDQTMIRDRHQLSQSIRRLQKAKLTDSRFQKQLTQFQKRWKRSLEFADKRRKSLPIPKFSGQLPIDARIEEIQQAIEQHQVLILCGETGSGKSTQLPKICLASGRGVYGLIGHTQPRRIAARSVANRIAEELGTSLGDQVGYKIRFTDTTKSHSYIKLMTDGILLAETQNDPYLNSYDTIIIDEAHERSLNIDFLLGYIQRILPKRPELRLIITSATIDAARFSDHFSVNNQPAPVLEVAGRTYPVELRYRPPEKNDEEEEADWTNHLISAVEEVLTEKNGDILIFLPTEREIREAAKVLRGHLLRKQGKHQNSEVLPLYGRLSEKEQRKVFLAHSQQRIVLATNVAESSITVPNIESVIDLGTARISRYSTRSQMQRLPIEAISQASANQRMGRCGRIAPGLCLRLYSEKDFLNREPFTPPEILRTNLAQVILQTLALKLGSIEDFPFLDAPKRGMIRDGYKTLFELGAINESQQLTEIGRQLAKLPTDPRIGRIILAGDQENCLNEILIIASGLEVQDPRERPVEFQQAADQAHAQFRNPGSDFSGLLSLWDFAHHLKQELSHSKYRKACKQNFLSVNRLREWSEIHRQLMQLAEEAGFVIRPRTNEQDAIHRALLAGFLANIAFLDDKKEYSGAGGTKRYLWPGSGLFSKKPKWIVSAEVIETSQRYARIAAQINPAWVEPIAKHLIKYTHTEPEWSKQRGCVMAWEKGILYGMTVVPRRRVNYGKVDAGHARELMIRDGFANFELETSGKFYQHNQEIIEQVREKQAKFRHHDFGFIEQEIIDFYDERIPKECYDLARFDKWRRKIEQTQPRYLYLKIEDFLEQNRAELDSRLFPDALVFENLKLPLSYQLQPGQDDDGVTVTVTPQQLNSLHSGLLDWLVPGLVEEKIAALIKTLPKSLRTLLIPAPDTARQVNSNLPFGQGSFLKVISLRLQRIAGEPVTPDAFDLLGLPRHLQMNIQVVNDLGEAETSSRSLELLQNQYRPTHHDQESGETASVKPAGPSLAQLAPRTAWHRDGIKCWEFENIPKSVELKYHAYTLIGYPSLIDTGSQISLRLRDHSDTAAKESRQGIYRLFQMELEPKIRQQLRWFPEIEKLDLLGSVYPGFKHIRQQLTECIAIRAFPEIIEIPRTNSDFRQLIKKGLNSISVAVQDVAVVMKPIVETYPAVLKKIEQLRGDLMIPLREDMKLQLDWLFCPNFLIETEWEQLAHYQRYCQGILLRCDKVLAGNLEKDRKAAANLEPYLQKMYLGKRQAHRNNPEWMNYRWMVEEYRISLFAQQLGTAQQVSPKRLDRQWKKANR